ncbi:MAG: AsmA-like C-terminal region-containing protein [Bacteroidales bacterium]
MSLLFALLLSLSTYFYLQKDVVKALFVEEINQHLLAPISTENITIGLFRSFPMASVEFSGIRGMGLNPNDLEPLFNAESISLNFSLIDIFQGRYNIKEIVVQGGEFNLKRYSDFSNNYIIWKYISKSNANVSFHLRRIVAQNTLIRYRDLGCRYDFQFLCKNIKAKGDLYKRNQFFSIKGSYHAQKFKSQDFVFLKNRYGKLNLKLKHQLKDRILEITQGNLSVENLHFKANGKINYNKNKNLLSLNISGNKLVLKDLISLLPNEEQSYLKNYHSDGILDCNLSIQGNYKYNDLLVIAKFDYTNGKIIHKPTKTALDQINIKGIYTNGNKRNLSTSFLKIDQFSATLPSGKIGGSFMMTNFITPTIKYRGTLEADLLELNQFFNLLPKDDLHGYVHADVYYENTFSSMSPQRWSITEFSHSKCNGYLNLSNIQWNIRPYSNASPIPIQADSLHIQFDPSVITIHPFQAEINHQILQSRIRIENLLPYYVLPNENIYVSAKLSASVLDIEKLKFLISISSMPSDSSKNTENSASKKTKDLLQHLYLDLDLKAEKIELERMNVSQVSTTIHYTPSDLRLDDLELNAFQGNFKGNISLNSLLSGYGIKAEGRIKEMNISPCFKAFNNFGQQQITYKNIDGQFSTDFRFSAIYIPKKGLLPESILLWTQIHLHSGKLQNMESLKKISKFTGENDLQNIHFADIDNTIEIQNQTIRIPQMRIVSDAANLEFTGSHNFNNEIDYFINIELSDLLSRNRKKRVTTEEFGIVEASSPGRLHLPLRITGTLAHPVFKYDFKTARKIAKERRLENKKEEQESVKEALSSEFQGSKGKAENRLQKEQWKKQEQGKFIIEDETENLKDSSSNNSKSTKKASTSKNKEKFRIEFTDE